MVEYLPKWHRIDDLLQMITFIGMKRPGYVGSTAYPLYLQMFQLLMYHRH